VTGKRTVAKTRNFTALKRSRIIPPPTACGPQKIAALEVQDAIIDGEIVALDEKERSSFQLLQDIAQEKAPIVYYAFDLPRLNGKSLQALPIEERKARSCKSY
jgi:ATP-dependent DNA ligase